MRRYDYTILEHLTPNALSDDVEQHMRRGYMIAGGVAVVQLGIPGIPGTYNEMSVRYVQAMVLVEDVDVQSGDKQTIN